MKKIVQLFFILSLFFSSFINGNEEKNSFIVTDNGFEMFHWDLDFIREAKQSIEISPAFLGGTIAQELLTEIKGRLEKIPELQVHILSSTILFETKDWQLIEYLLEKYPNNFHLEVPVSVPIVWPDISAIDNHLKMVIVDETYFSTGGTNLDETQATEGTWTPPRTNNKVPVVSKNLPAAMRDQDVVGRGPLAKKLREAFYQHYALWEHYNSTGIFERDPEQFKNRSRYFPVNSQISVARFEESERRHDLRADQFKLLLSGSHQHPNEITREYIRLIQGAKEEIVLSHMYFSPVEPLLKALLNAVNRGVKVTLLTNGVSEVAPEYTKFFCWANRINYVPLLYGNTYHFWDAWTLASKPIKKVRIFEYHLKDVLLHKKSMVVDNKFVVIGGYNLGYRSDLGDYELVLIFDSEEVVHDVASVYAVDLKYVREVTPAEARQWYFDPFIASLGEMQKRFHGLL